MAETPKKSKQSPQKKLKPSPNSSSTIPPTPQALAPPRRSSRLISSPEPSLPPVQPTQSSNRSSRRSLSYPNQKNPQKSIKPNLNPAENVNSPNLKLGNTPTTPIDTFLSPLSPNRYEDKKRKSSGRKSTNVSRHGSVPKRRVFYKKVSYDGGEFSVGDDVYVKRREDASSDNEDPEVEECRVCFKAGKAVMIECDGCLGGFHLKCLKPPLKAVPDGDWICGFCEAKKLGKKVDLPVPPKGKKLVRTAKEKLLSSDLWAVHIVSMWKEVDGTFWFRGRWYIIPEETAAGRQPHNLKRELYVTNEFADNEVIQDFVRCSFDSIF